MSTKQILGVILFIVCIIVLIGSRIVRKKMLKDLEKLSEGNDGE